MVIPFYNEAKKFDFFRNQLLEYLPHNTWYGEIICVNDGSSDETPQLLDNLSSEIQQIPIKVIHLPLNKGKGFAVKTGILAANCSWVLCNDADFSYLPSQIDAWENESWLNLNSSVPLFGSRELGMDKGWVKFKWHRRIIGRIYSILIRIFTGIKETDTQCGFKLYPTSLAKEIFSSLREERFAFDVEVHYILKQKALQPIMLPVHCVDYGDSKVHLLKDSWQMWKALLRIKHL